MVERSDYLDGLFGSLSDPIRRHILGRLRQESSSIGALARDYALTFAAVAKHVEVLVRARLVIKEKRGKERIVHLVPQGLKDADEYLKQFEDLWNRRFQALDQILEEDL